MMKITIAILAIVLSISYVSTSNAASIESESWKRLVAEMRLLYGERPLLSRTIDKKKIRIDLCPDETCVGVKTTRHIPFDVVADFFYLLEFYVVPYYEQEKEWKPRREVSVYAQELLEKYRTQFSCEVTSEKEIAHCVLRYLIKTQGIKIVISRYDEGHKEDSYIEIDELFK